MNLLEVTKTAERLKRVAKVLDDATSKRLAALIEERSKQAMEDSEGAREYDEGFKHGLNAGLRVSKTEFADLDAAMLCEAFNGDIED